MLILVVEEMESDDEGEADEVINQVLDEIGIKIQDDLNGVRPTEKNLSPKGQDEDIEKNLQERFEKLQRKS